MNTQIIFVDSSVQDYQTLLKGASELAKIVLLDQQYNGIEQISATLAENQNVEAVHIISHGSPGSIQLGNSQLNLENLNRYNSQIQQWGKSLTEKAIILLYGCSVAAGITGIAFQKRLSQLVGASVAANDKPTGNSLLGGDWQLKSATGAIQTPLALAEEVMAAYPWILGIHLVKDIFPGSNDFGIYNFNNVDDTLYFQGSDPIHGKELWKSDGTEAGTVLVKDIDPGIDDSNPYKFTNVNGTLYFITRKSLWKSDGTEAGTVLVKDSFVSLSNLTNVNGTLYFGAWDGSSNNKGNEGLWKSDGTKEGTVLVQDMISIRGHLENFTNLNGTLYFIVANYYNLELWKSDGTEEGTVFFKHIVDLNELGAANGISPFTNFDRNLWLNYNVVNGNQWFNSYLTIVNGTAYFEGYDDTHGRELWKSDGTKEGTVFFKDINPGSGHSMVNYFINVNGTLYFTADDGTHDKELWKSDGTEEGTMLVKDICPPDSDYAHIFPDNLTNINGTLYFRSDDGTGSALWKSDGTKEGTVLVKDINPGSGNAGPDYFINVNGTLFFQADDGIHGYELWALTPFPVVTTVSATTADDSYGIGQTITITASFDEAVAVDTTGGTPRLQLATGTTAQYATYFGGSGTDTLTFNYIIQAGDNSVDLQYVATNSLELNGGTVKANGLDANLTLPSLTSPLSLGGSKNLAIDTTAPTVIINQDSTQPDPTSSSTVNFTVVFSEVVTGFDNSDITLSGTSGATIATVTGSGTTYKVAVSGMTSNGNIIAEVTANAATDLAGNVSVASSSTDNTVTYILSPEIQVLDGTTDLVDGTTNALDFGSTILGEVVTKTFTINNTGTAALNLSDLTLPTGFSLVGDLPNAIASGAEANLTVQLDATAVGTSNGTLQFTNNDSNENPFDFTISGNVTATPTPEQTSTQTPESTATPTGCLCDLFPTPDLGILTLIPNEIADPLLGTDARAIDSATSEEFNLKDGHDSVLGLGGGDNLYGDASADLLFGNSGNDYIDGGAQNDLIFAGQDNDAVNGGQDRDTVLGNLGNDTLLGGDGNDLLGGNQSSDTLDGEGGNDIIFGGQDNDALLGNIGNDTVAGDLGDDLVKGSDGNDWLFGNTGADFVAGGAGEDTIFAGKDADIGKGGEGHDIVAGDIGNDSLCGGLGNDVLYGNVGVDSMDGCQGDDTLYGGKDNDTLIGNIGNDVLNGELGNDFLMGGTGSDKFVLSPDGGQDILADFEEGIDKLVLAGGLTFDQLSIGMTSNETLITLLTKGELLATLYNVQSSLITEEYFALFESN